MDDQQDRARAAAAQRQAEADAADRNRPDALRQVPQAEPSRTGHERARLPQPHDPANPAG